MGKTEEAYRLLEEAEAEYDSLVVRFNELVESYNERLVVQETSDALADVERVVRARSHASNKRLRRDVVAFQEAARATAKERSVESVLALETARKLARAKKALAAATKRAETLRIERDDARRGWAEDRRVSDAVALESEALRTGIGEWADEYASLRTEFEALAFPNDAHDSEQERLIESLRDSVRVLKQEARRASDEIEKLKESSRSSEEEIVAKKDVLAPVESTTTTTLSEEESAPSFLEAVKGVFKLVAGL